MKKLPKPLRDRLPLFLRVNEELERSTVRHDFVDLLVLIATICFVAFIAYGAGQYEAAQECLKIVKMGASE